MTSNGKEQILIFDTTLRDGEQSPGATMTFEEKLEVAELLDEMGIDIIEAGLGSTHPGVDNVQDLIAELTLVMKDEIRADFEGRLPLLENFLEG